MAHNIRIQDGRITFVYDDAIADLLEVGQGEVRRASHVEPAPGGGWTADMGPVDGPVLGPFPLRADALTAERVWLTEHRGL